MKTEEPEYRIINPGASGNLDDVEIREYKPQLVAETKVSGERREASSEGFRILADFIFGNNKSQSKIEMTAPVTQDKSDDSEKIAMTAPVTQVKNDDLWTIRFMMPSEYTMETLPTPNNEKVTIRELPAARYAVLQFSGFARQQLIADKTRQLLAAVENAGLNTIGGVSVAQYNPPWTPAPERRNEVMIQIDLSE